MHIKLCDLAPVYQRQAMAQLGNGAKNGAKTDTPKQGKTDTPELKPLRRQMNKTEALYQQSVLRGAGLYEGLTLRLPGGSRYTPDFITFDEQGRVTCHEVKGSFKLGSHGRSVTAFREAAAVFPFSFIFARKDKAFGFVSFIYEKTPIKQEKKGE